MPGFRGNSILDRLPEGRCLAAEIGVFDGSLSDTLLARHRQLDLIMVDAWSAPDADSRWAQSGDPFARNPQTSFSNAKKQAESRTGFAQDRRRILHMTSLEAAAQQDDASLDLVFIDAEHTREAVDADLEAWAPKVKPGGYLAGHDWEPECNPRKYGVNEAVVEWAMKNNLAATLEFGEDATWFIRIPPDGKPRTIADYVALLDSGQPFTQSNWGDGEWLCFLGASGENCDGHEYLPELSADLRGVLANPHPHFHGINPGRKLWPQVNEWRRRNRGINWVEKEIMPNANCRGELGPLIAALRRRTVVLVGPQHLFDLPAFDVAAHAVVPDKNCYAAISRIMDDVLFEVERQNADTVLFSASMATNVMIHRLWPKIGERVTMLDCGALWSPYCGHRIRNGYRKDSWVESMVRNLDEAKKITPRKRDRAAEDMLEKMH